VNKLVTWLYIITAVLVAVAANSISAVWAGKENRFFSPWFVAVIVISPIVFVTFGLVTTKLGLAASSATVDVLLTVTTILVGLLFFHEWGNMTWYQLLGMVLAITGMILLQLHR